jgi:hypothetical protein
MSGSPRTAAEQQIELLRRLKAQQAKRRPAPIPVPTKIETELAAPPTRPESGFEIHEKGSVTTARKLGPSLPLSRPQWQRLRERQRVHREFRNRREMGDWAAELLLALPPGVFGLGDAARRDLLEAMRGWARSRGFS